MTDDSLRGTPAVPPQNDPKSVTVAGQARSPVLTESSQLTNASWGPIPVMSQGLTFTEMGQTGLRQFSGWVREEFLQVLTGRQGAQKYREMTDNSSTIGGLLFAIRSMMRKVEWREEPADDTPEAQEAADFLASCREDMSMTWSDVIDEALSMLSYGFSPLEIVYKQRLGLDPGPDRNNPRGESLPQSKYDDGMIGWRRLPIRSQDTIIKWFFDENGQTKGLTQQPWVGSLVDIPIEKLLLFRPNIHKNNPEGRSILRTSYTSYYYQKRLQEQEAILFERLGGIPVIRIPSVIIQAAATGDSGAVAQLNAYKKIAVNLRNDEQMGLVLPSDTYNGVAGPSNIPQYTFELVTPSLSRANLGYDETIKRYGVGILMSVLADFLTLGHEARGTQSLAITKVDLFFNAMEGYLNSMAEVFNRYGIPRLWDLNGLDRDLMPKVVPDLAQRVDLDVLSNYVLRLAQAGMPIFPDEDIQSYLKDAAGLPDIDDRLALQAAGLTPEQLDMEDEKQQTVLENMQNPPEPGKPPLGRTNLEKMILKALAQRQVRYSGSRFGVRTASKTRKGHVHKHRRPAMEIPKFLVAAE